MYTYVGPGQQPVGAANIQGRPVAPTVSVSAQGRPTNYKYTANMRNPPQPMPVAQQPPVQQVHKCLVFCAGEEMSESEVNWRHLKFMNNIKAQMNYMNWINQAGFLEHNASDSIWEVFGFNLKSGNHPSWLTFLMVKLY